MKLFKKINNALKRRKGNNTRELSKGSEIIELEEIIDPESKQFLKELQTEGHAIQQSLEYPSDFPPIIDDEIVDLTPEMEVSRNSLAYYCEVYTNHHARQPGLIKRYHEGLKKQENQDYCMEKNLASRLLEISKKTCQSIVNEGKVIENRLERVYKKAYNPVERVILSITGKKNQTKNMVSYMIELNDSLRVPGLIPITYENTTYKTSKFMQKRRQVKDIMTKYF